MYTASDKKRENIAEYLLYMWQIEDLIRANGLDIDRIQKEIIDSHTNLTDARKHEMREWYESLIDMMRREGVEEKGHLQLNKNTVLDLTNLHNRLLDNPAFADYAAEYYNTLPYIVELRAKAGKEKAGEIETAFNALYGILMLRLAGKEVTPQTMDAVKSISKFLARLAAYYKKDYNNELDLDKGK